MTRSDSVGNLPPFWPLALVLEERLRQVDWPKYKGCLQPHLGVDTKGTKAMEEKLEQSNDPGHRANPVDSPEGATIPRHIAAMLDNLLAMIAGLVIAKQFPDDRPIVQICVLVSVFLGYYFVTESLFSASPAKWMNGLVIRSIDGGKCSLRQTTIRTLMRLIEVNPVLLGGIPAAASILWSKNKQRFGDKIAKTVVVLR